MARACAWLLLLLPCAAFAYQVTQMLQSFGDYVNIYDINNLFMIKTLGKPSHSQAIAKPSSRDIAAHGGGGGLPPLPPPRACAPLCPPHEPLPP